MQAASTPGTLQYTRYKACAVKCNAALRLRQRACAVRSSIRTPAQLQVTGTYLACLFSMGKLIISKPFTHIDAQRLRSSVCEPDCKVIRLFWGHTQVNSTAMWWHNWQKEHFWQPHSCLTARGMWWELLAPRDQVGCTLSVVPFSFAQINVTSSLFVLSFR